MFISLDDLILLCLIMMVLGFGFTLGVMLAVESITLHKKQTPAKNRFKPRRRYYLNLSKK